MNAETPILERPGFRFLWTRAGLFVGFLVTGAFFLGADSRSGHIYATVTGIVCFLFVILPPVRVAGRCIHPIITAPLALLVSFVAVGMALPPYCSPGSVEQYAAPIIRQLDEYHRVHGRYPPTLKAAGITPPRLRCGTFDYTLDADGRCGLSIGDYALDNFSAWWDSDSRKWYLDT